MRRAAAVVLPSTYGEGIPRSLIEAAAAGVPIITTDTPGCRDAVLAGASGFLCPANAPDALAAAMMELLSRPQLVRAMGAMGRRLAGPDQHISLDGPLDGEFRRPLPLSLRVARFREGRRKRVTKGLGVPDRHQASVGAVDRLLPPKQRKRPISQQVHAVTSPI